MIDYSKELGTIHMVCVLHIIFNYGFYVCNFIIIIFYYINYINKEISIFLLVNYVIIVIMTSSNHSFGTINFDSTKFETK